MSSLWKHSCLPCPGLRVSSAFKTTAQETSPQFVALQHWFDCSPWVRRATMTLTAATGAPRSTTAPYATPLARPMRGQGPRRSLPRPQQELQARQPVRHMPRRRPTSSCPGKKGQAGEEGEESVEGQFSAPEKRQERSVVEREKDAGEGELCR